PLEVPPPRRLVQDTQLEMIVPLRDLSDVRLRPPPPGLLPLPLVLVPEPPAQLLAAPAPARRHPRHPDERHDDHGADDDQSPTPSRHRSTSCDELPSGPYPRRLLRKHRRSACVARGMDLESAKGR